MKSRREHVRGSVVLSLLLVTAPVFADESATEPAFTYTDDWAVVSAPPPPGPYHAVNIDPRVPGVDAIPPLSMDEVIAPTRKDIPTEAPAAGIAATRPPPDRPAAALDSRSSAQTVTPAGAGQVPPFPSSRYYYPAPPRYPVQTHSVPPSGYPAYRNQPIYGYGSPTHRQGLQQVPPPPLYDSMIRNQQSYGYPAGKGTP